MSIEDELKELILAKYKSIREFSLAVALPYSTIDSILKRGISNANIGNIIKICRHFNLSTDDLADGKIVYLKPKTLQVIKNETAVELKEDSLDELAKRGNLTNSEKEAIIKYMKLDYTTRQIIISGFEATIDKYNELSMSEQAKNEIEKNLENYRIELEAEQKGQTLSALRQSKENIS